MSFCDFVLSDRDDGRVDARCTRCGRQVITKSRNVIAACKASDQYASSHARLTGLSPVDGGPGTELRSLLSEWLGITSEPGCACERHAMLMDLWGPDECERRVDEIVSWLREEHAKRRDAGQTRLPWTDLGATQLVKLACRRARAKAAS